MNFFKIYIIARTLIAVFTMLRDMTQPITVPLRLTYSIATVGTVLVNNSVKLDKRI